MEEREVWKEENSEAAALTEADQEAAEKCTMQHAVSARKLARFHLSQQQTGKFSA